MNAEAEAIKSVVISEAYSKAVQWLLECRGKVVTIGVGKAGHIANKFAATLCSTGTPAVFLHAAEAAHGDLGVLNRDDVLIAFSTSGKSREVLEAIQLSRNLGISHAIGVTSHPESELRGHCDLILDMGGIREACPHGLTPTCSIAVMLAMSDGIAIATMEARGFKREDFGLRHHGGYLGKAAKERP